MTVFSDISCAHLKHSPVQAAFWQNVIMMAHYYHLIRMSSFAHYRIVLFICLSSYGFLFGIVACCDTGAISNRNVCVHSVTPCESTNIRSHFLTPIYFAIAAPLKGCRLCIRWQLRSKMLIHKTFLVYRQPFVAKTRRLAAHHRNRCLRSISASLTANKFDNNKTPLVWFSAAVE